MGWFRFDDQAIDHPKLLALTDGAFRLWIEAGSYCNKHLTDGLILTAAVGGFRYVTAKRIAELVEQQLWEADAKGFRIHHYHEWNDSSAVIKAKKEQHRERTRKWRDVRVTNASGDASRDAHTPYGVVRTDLSNKEDLTKEDQSARSSSTEEIAKVMPRSSGRQRGRLFLHRWQLDVLIDTLGPHADTFDLDGWLDDLNRRIAAQALPQDPWKFVQAELHAEILTRGLAVALERAKPKPMSKLEETLAFFAAGGTV